MSAIGRFLVGWVIGIPLRGWVLSTLWLWFCVPTFAVKALSVQAALGIAVLVALLTQTYRDSDAGLRKKETDAQGWLRVVSMSVLWPLLCLGVGWVYRQFL